MFLLYAAAVLLAAFVNLRTYFACARRAGRRNLAARGDDGPIVAPTIAFFHPYANSGGGGERVLWLAVKALQLAHGRGVQILIYTGDTDSAQTILDKTRERFGVDFDDGKVPPTFVRLRRRRWIEAARWPRFTMIGQSLGSMVLALEAVFAFTPDVFIDTTGLAFSFPVAKLLAGCRVAAYVHYPTISTDMLRSVAVAKRPSYNNDASISASRWRTCAKLVYYHAFALLYRLVGRCCCDVVMANSSWTAGHIRSLWGQASIVYPPCDVSTFAAFPLDGPNDNDGRSRGRSRVVVSVSQYRPEKDQQLQIRALARLHAAHPAECGDVSLVLIGSCRHADDHAIADGLEALARELGILHEDGGGSGGGGGTGRRRGTVSVLRNLPYGALQAWLARATAGIHTMCVRTRVHSGVAYECLRADVRACVPCLLALRVSRRLRLHAYSTAHTPHTHAQQQQQQQQQHAAHPTPHPRARCGTRTPFPRWNEHFGIGVVEMQAAGAVTVAHDSAGPQMDIIVPAARGGDKLDARTGATGFLASSVEEYAAVRSVRVRRMCLECVRGLVGGLVHWLAPWL
jgi:glycosyltransferase involved in cell wall biosynthesis